MAAPLVATGNPATALPATDRTSRAVATVRTSPAVAIGPISPAVATDHTSRAAAIGPRGKVATGHSHPVRDSTDRLTRERCPSGSIRAV